MKERLREDITYDRGGSLTSDEVVQNILCPNYILILVVGYGFLTLEISVLVDGMWGSVVTLRYDMTES